MPYRTPAPQSPSNNSPQTVEIETNDVSILIDYKSNNEPISSAITFKGSPSACSSWGKKEVYKDAGKGTAQFKNWMADIKSSGFAKIDSIFIPYHLIQKIEITKTTSRKEVVDINQE